MTELTQTWANRCWNVLVLAGLLALAYWGHATQWRIGSFASIINAEAAPKKDKRDTDKPRPSGGAFAPIEFESADVIRQVGIESQKAEERDLEVAVSANATVGYDPTKVTQVSSRVTGFIAKVNAHQGQYVKAGDVIAFVDSPDVGAGRTDLLQEFSSHYFASKRLERLQGLARQGAVPDATLREAEIAVLETRSKRFSAQQKLLNLGMKIDLDALEKLSPDQLARRIQSLGITEAELKHIDIVGQSANLIPLLAPSSGIVTQYDLVTGKRVTPDRSEIEIADVRLMAIRISLRKEDAGKLALGQRVRYSGVATNGTACTGKLTFISTQVDEKTRTVQARALVENPALGPTKNGDEGPWLLRAGEYGTCTVTTGMISKAIVVPSKALQRLDDNTLVFVLRNDGKSFETRKVEIGEHRDEWVQIRSGVHAGETVATSNSFVLKSELLKDRLEAP
ncbi:MAG: efflux RND transporter periplasmic adaptor subunit [Planctomycetes bacterium]|nr:efflux RND transporter periplasmic adaptor subunit [Planctomycetota bacterium]